MSTNPILNLYMCTVKSILTVSIAAGFVNLNAQECKNIQKVVDTVQTITDIVFLAIKGNYLKQVANIIKDPHHSGHTFFSLLPSGRRYRTENLLVHEQLLPNSHQTTECYKHQQIFELQTLHCTRDFGFLFFPLRPLIYLTFIV